MHSAIVSYTYTTKSPIIVCLPGLQVASYLIICNLMNIAEPKFELKSFRPSSCIFHGRGRI